MHPRSSRTAKLIGYDQANAKCARIVLENIPRFGGDQAGLVIWARAVMRRIGDKAIQASNGFGRNDELSGARRQTIGTPEDAGLRANGDHRAQRP
jgi:hypothetical protein